MAALDKLDRQIVETIFDHAMGADGPATFEESDLIYILRTIAGAPIVRAYIYELLSMGLLRQVSADPIEFEITMDLIRAARQARDEAISVSPPAEAKTRHGSTYASFKDTLLLALARKDAEAPKYYDLREVCEDASLAYQPGWVRKAAQDFESVSYVRTSFTMGGSEDSGLHVKLSGAGLEEAENIALSLGENIYSKDAKSTVPASDRFVSVSHNQPYEDTIAALDELLRAAPNNNEFGDLVPDKDERVAIQSEWSSLREWLTLPKVNLAVVRPIAERLKWLGSKLVDAMLGALARKVLDGLMHILPGLF